MSDPNVNLNKGPESNPQPYYPAPAAGAPAYGAAKPETNTLALVSLIAGISAFVVTGLIGAIVAIITGHMATKELRVDGKAGAGFAKTGLILGYVSAGLHVLGGIVFIILIATGLIFGANSYSSNKTSYDRAQQQYQQCVDQAGSSADAVAACTDQLAQSLPD